MRRKFLGVAWRGTCHAGFVNQPSHVDQRPHLADPSAGNTEPGCFKRNGLSLAFAGLSLVTVIGHAIAGFAVDRAERIDHHDQIISFLAYLGSGAFLSSLLENWESEFLQVALFVFLTVFLRQKGSSESRPFVEPPAESHPLEEAPWPVRRGGLWLKVYEHSLSLALFLLFALCFVGHMVASWRHHLTDEIRHGETGQTLFEHVTSSQFWFESLQNWQSEFVSITALVLLSIYLREKDSSQSKDVAAPHSHTGE